MLKSTFETNRMHLLQDLEGDFVSVKDTCNTVKPSMRKKLNQIRENVQVCMNEVACMIFNCL